MASGGDIVRLLVSWQDIAGALPPAEASNPADPSYDFAALDGAVREASARGLRVMLTLGVAPRWAEGPNRPASAVGGSWKPDPSALGGFAAAVAIRYSGGFRPSSMPFSPSLPAVRYFQVWNEPNLETYLTPQWTAGKRPGRRKPVSPRHYRKMVNAVYRAVNAVNQENLVVTAGTAPYGHENGLGHMRPMRFWRSLACVRPRSLKPLRCPGPVRFDIAAHHPITGAPRSHPDSSDDATIPDLGRIARIVRAGTRAKAVRPKARKPLWVTEIWWETNLPDPAGIPVARQARWIAEALYLIWKQRVDTALLLQVGDDPLPGGIQAGIFFADGVPKPSTTAVRFPFASERRSRDTVIAWGQAPVAGDLGVEQLIGGLWTARTTFPVEAGEVFRIRLPVSGPTELRAAVGGQTSLAFRQR